MENLRIAIVGNIGVGKSTLVKAASTEPLQQLLLDVYPEKDDMQGVFAFQEEFDPIVLDAFYKDPVKYAFMAQIEFFNGRLDRQIKIQGCKGIVLEDRTLHEDYHIFGKAQKVLKNMTEAEFRTYSRTFHLMTEKVSPPDLVVYLRADVETVLERIAKRGRESEKQIEPEYLRLLHELYEEYINRFVECPVLVIDANKKNDLSKERFLKKTIKQIAEKIKNLELRVSSPGIGEWVRLPQTKATLKAVDSEKRLEEYLRDNPKLITVAGNVGLGKSTLTAIMERTLKLKGLYEAPEENPLLEKFLGDKKKYCFELQRHFLRMRSEQRLQGKSGDGSYIKDRSFAEDLLVFCYQFEKDGILTADELNQLITEFKQVNMTLPSADLMIILKGNAKLAWSRIQQRGREMETEGGWSLSDIRNLNEWYQTYHNDVLHYGFHKGPILEIDVEKVDLTNRIHCGYIFEQIYDMLKG